MFVSKFDFGAGAGRSRAFSSGAGAEKKYLEPELRKNGSAPQHWLFVYIVKSSVGNSVISNLLRICIKNLKVQ